ncbi:hypothetical protein [Parvicella tangerina]|uniref:Uncharacterized protein n=1 Tax=Parvicella tangerina TaxID=2829795 RepID=A0A916JNH0_9FLAO|nr:hypothetical protein [Parvicella tangerina]CAG5083757.1 hypothetical protein CRYO30217_02281 [Parvicella tangerina]
MKSHEEIVTRLAQYRNHTINITPTNGKSVTEMLLKHWKELKTFIIRYEGISDPDLTHVFHRQEFPHDPKGEAFLKHIDYHNYVFKQEDFNFRMGYASSYGPYSSTPLSVRFELNYYHSGEHQFGITDRLSGEKNLIHQLELSSMDHTKEELTQLANQLLGILKKSM